MQKGFDLAIGHSLILIAILIFLAFMYWNKRLPTVETFRNASTVAETHGGQIIILTTMALVFFIVSMGFAYYIMDAIIDQTIKPDNAMVMVMLNWVTGAAFGNVMGALIKTMSAPAVVNGGHK